MLRDLMDVRLGNRMRELREGRRLSILNAGWQLGIDHRRFRRCEAGEDRIGASMLLELSRILKSVLPDFFETAPGAVPFGTIPPEWRDAVDRT